MEFGRDQRAERNHLSGGIAQINLADIRNIVAVSGGGLKFHLVGFSVFVEIIDVGVSESALQCIGNIIDADAEFHRLFPVDRQIDLRRRRLVGGVDVGKDRTGIGFHQHPVEFLLELLRRQGVGTVLQHHRKTADRAQTRNRGHAERGDRCAGDVLDGVVETHHHCILGLVFVWPFRPAFQRHDTQCAVAGVDAVDEVVAGNENRIIDFGKIFDGLPQTRNHLFRAVQGSSVRQLDCDEKSALVFIGDKSGRQRLEDFDCAESHGGIKDHHQNGFPNQRFHQCAVFCRHPVEKGVEPAEEDEFLAVGIGRFQDQSAECWTEGERVDRGKGNRDGNRDPELAVHHSGDAGKETDRHEHGQKNQCGGNTRTGNHPHGLDGCIPGTHMFLIHKPADALDDHDRIVHHHADGEDQTEERDQIDAESDYFHEGEGADQGHGNGNGRDQRGTPVLKENISDQNDQQHGDVKGFRHFVDGCIDELRGVVGDSAGKIAGEGCLFDLRQPLIHEPGDLQTVGIVELIDRQQGGWFPVQSGDPVVTLGAHFHFGNIPQTDLRTVGVGTDDDVAEGFRIGHTALCGDREPCLLTFRGRAVAQGAGGNLHVLCRNGVLDVADGDPERSHTHIVQPDTHGISERAELGNIADAGDTRDLVLDRDRHEIAQFLVAVSVGGRIKCNDCQHVAGGFLGGESLTLHFLRKRGFRPVHPVLRIDGVFVSVRPDVKKSFDGGDAVIRGR